VEYAPKTRAKPRMSAPKLGEYLEATANRRERILRDQKYPPVFKQVRYRRAEHSIRRAMTEGGDVVTRMELFAQRVDALPASTRYEAEANRCSALAIRRFARIYCDLPIKGAMVLPIVSPFSLAIEGVTISVAPLALLKRSGRAGVVQSGAVLAVFRKNEMLGDRSGRAVAELLRRVLIEAGHPGVRPELCIVVDIFSAKVISTTARGHRVAEEVESACREIAARWPALKDSRAA
jgi:hypothetical protein